MKSKTEQIINQIKTLTGTINEVCAQLGITRNQYNYYVNYEAKREPRKARWTRNNEKARLNKLNLNQITPNNTPPVAPNPFETEDW